MHVTFVSSDYYEVQKISGEIVQFPKEEVQKIGGNIPINVVVFDDGADVYSSVQVNNFFLT